MYRRRSLTRVMLLLCASLFAGAVLADDQLAFPGAQGWAAHTPGGRGGKVIRVTTLAPKGPGSLLAALETKGPRIVVFEVGGVIDFGRQEVNITEPYLTIAGQTAPSPGITIIRAGINLMAHDVIIQHIRVRTGEAGAAKTDSWEPDAFSTQRAYNVIVDHCSMTWGIDENLSASGARIRGDTPQEWRDNTSRRITFSNNIIAEGLANSTHPKGEHSKGSLIHDHVREILIVGNLYAHNMERNPLFKGDTQGVVVNNLIYNPGTRAAHYNLIANEWGASPFQTGHLVFIGNVLRAGPSTSPDIAFFMLGGSGDVEYYGEDNIMVDRMGRPLPEFAKYSTGAARIIKLNKRPALPFGVSVMSAVAVQDHVLANAGARPWDRDAIDLRILADTIEGRGKILDSEQEVGGYPKYPETRQPFNEKEWNLSNMTRREPIRR